VKPGSRDRARRRACGRFVHAPSPGAVREDGLAWAQRITPAFTPRVWDWPKHVPPHHACRSRRLLRRRRAA
jgi:hypothetical protein